MEVLFFFSILIGLFYQAYGFFTNLLMLSVIV